MVENNNNNRYSIKWRKRELREENTSKTKQQSQQLASEHLYTKLRMCTACLDTGHLVG